jgi:hypothetical protein
LKRIDSRMRMRSDSTRGELAHLPLLLLGRLLRALDLADVAHVELQAAVAGAVGVLRVDEAFGILLGRAQLGEVELEEQAGVGAAVALREAAAAAEREADLVEADRRQLVPRRDQRLAGGLGLRRRNC